MSYPYNLSREKEIHYTNGVCVTKLAIHDAYPEIEESGIEFFRVNMQAGSQYQPELSSDRIALLCFDGRPAYVSGAEGCHVVEEPSFYIPEFAAYRYVVGAVDDMEFILAYFPMNEWDWNHYKNYHLHLPFFMKQTDGVPYTQSCKKGDTKSWNILSSARLGHLMVGVVRATGEGTDEKGHAYVHQWNYCLGNADFDLDVEGESCSQKAGDFSFVYAGKDHSLLAKPGKEVYYVWIEFFTEENLDIFEEYRRAYRSTAEAYAHLVEERSKAK